MQASRAGVPSARKTAKRTNAIVLSLALIVVLFFVGCLASARWGTPYQRRVGLAAFATVTYPFSGFMPEHYGQWVRFDESAGPIPAPFGPG